MGCVFVVEGGVGFVWCVFWWSVEIGCAFGKHNRCDAEGQAADGFVCFTRQHIQIVRVQR